MILQVFILYDVVLEVGHLPLEHILEPDAGRAQLAPAPLAVLRDVLQAHQLLVAQDLPDHSRNLVNDLLLVVLRLVEWPQVVLLGLEVEVEELAVNILVVLG